MPRVATSREVQDLGDADWYRLPAWYDVLHAHGTAGEVDGLEALATRWCTCSWRGRMRWFEPACGTGRYLYTAAKRGTDVAGFDALQGMIDYASARFGRAGMAADLRVGTFSDFEPPKKRAHLGFCLINSLRHASTDEEIAVHLGRMRSAIEPGGVYAIGMNISAPGTEMPSEDVWSGARGTCTVTQLVQYQPPAFGTREERVYSHLAVTTPKREVHLDTQYRLRTFSGAQWRAILDDSPFELVAIADETGTPIAELDDPRWAGEHGTGYAVWVLTPR